MRKTTHILILFSIITMLALAPGASLWAAPQLPSSFYGTVTVDGANAADGTPVTAWINGVQYAQTTTFTSEGSSVYTLDVPGDDPETPGLVEGGMASDTVVFKVDGQAISQTGTWQTGSNVALNLSYTSPTAVSITLPVDMIAPINDQATVPVSLGSDVSALSIFAYSFVVAYDPDVIQFTDVEKTATLSAGWTISYNKTAGQVQIAAYGTSVLSGSGPLLNLLFDTSNNGGARSDITFTSFKFNEGAPAAQTSNGSVIVGSLNISGQVTYTPNNQPVSGVALSATGTSTGNTTSGDSGAYTLAINAVGDYTVTASKSDDLRDALSGLDAAYILQYVVGTRSFDAYQSAVGDVSQNDGVTAYDAALVALYLVGRQDPPSLAGQWAFLPVSRSYAPLNSDSPDQNYTASLYGDVTENWGPIVAQVRNAAASSPTIRPSEAVGRPGETVRVAFQLTGLDATAVYAIELDLAFDGTVVTFLQASPADQIDSSWQLVANGSQDKVSLVAFGATPLQATGDVIYFDFQVIGHEGDETTLTPERLRINEEQPISFAEAAGKIVIPISGTSGNAVFLPFINGTSAVERSIDTALDVYIPLVDR